MLPAITGIKEENSWYYGLISCGVAETSNLGEYEDCPASTGLGGIREYAQDISNFSSAESISGTLVAVFQTYETPSRAVNESAARYPGPEKSRL